MPQYRVQVAFDGSGELTIRSDSEENARDDAESLTVKDVETVHDGTLTVLHVEEIGD